MSTANGFTIKKALLNDFKLRLSLAGTSGSGKTYTALRIASLMGGKTCVIDTERKSASKYAKEFSAKYGFEYDVIELEDFHPSNYVGAIQAIEDAGYDTIIIDSTTHEWNGKNGCLELADQFARQSRSGNTFNAWAKVTPLHAAFIDAIIGSPCHIISTVRSKTDYVQEKNENTGKTEIRKVGMANVQRDGMEYEYDIALEIDTDHVATVSKTRCSQLSEKMFRLTLDGTEEIVTTVKQWLSSGAPAEKVSVETAERILEVFSAAGVNDNQNQIMTFHGCRAKDVYSLTVEQGAKLLQVAEHCAAILKIVEKAGWQERLNKGAAAFGGESLFLLPAAKLPALRSKIEDVWNAEKASAAAARLDEWKCGKDLALEVLNACKAAEAAGVTEAEWRDALGHLEGQPESRKALTTETARVFIECLDELVAEKKEAEANEQAEDSEQGA